MLGLWDVIRAASEGSFHGALRGAALAVALGWATACHAPPTEPSGERRSDEVKVATETLPPAETPVAVSQEPVEDADAYTSRVLLDVDTLDDWETGVFGNPDDFEVTDTGIIIPQTSTLAGMTYRGVPPKTPYVMHVDVTKRYGDDFFLGLTFPVRDSHLTLVLGGWGGGVSGLSVLDGEDASENNTKHVEYFPNGKRQTVIVDVNDERVIARLDGRVLVDADLRGKELGLRTEVLASRPVGVATFATSSLIHSITVDERP